MSSAESRYSAAEIELLAVVWAIKKANTFLAGTSFELIVDHFPLAAIINSKYLDQISSPRLLRLNEKLSPHCLTAVCRRGAPHKVVDCFSRHPVEHAGSGDDGVKLMHVCCQLLLQSMQTMIHSCKRCWPEGPNL